MPRRAPSDNREVDPRVESWMRRAIALAKVSQPHPNPRVGAVVLTPEGDEIGAASHLGPGSPHAEISALEQAGSAARGATVVSTLEPCAHHGRTPPCTDALIAAGVGKVVFGAVDPDERVSGAGMAQLREAGIEVREGVLAAEVESADPGYFHHRRTGRPRFRVKLAATLDGQVAAADGTSQWITSVEARQDAHRLRAAADAVAVGAGTLRTDDPQLDVRLDGFAGHQPRPVVFAGRGALPADCKLYSRNPLIFVPEPHPGIAGAELVVAGGNDGVDLNVAAKELAKRGLLEILVDGGPTLAAALLRAGMADELTLYLGAAVAGGSGAAMFAGLFATIGDIRPVAITAVSKIGPDLRIDARPTKEAG